MRLERSTKPVILVTGSNGFIGSALVERLSKDSYSTIATVRNEIKRKFDEGVSLVNTGNLASFCEWQKILNKVDVVIHLASRVHVMKDFSEDELSEYRNINVEATINLAWQAAQAGVKRFVYLSTVKVNGEFTATGCRFTADDDPVPKGPYAISKYEAEQGLRKVAKETGMELVIIRPPLVYGPGVKANFLNMMRLLTKSIPLPFGCVKNLRSFVALDNLVDLIVICIEHTSAAGQVFLVSDGEDLSTKDLLLRMGRALGKKPCFIFIPVPWLIFFATLVGRRSAAERLCSSLQVDISKTCRVLQWSPVVGVDEALMRVAQSLKIK